MFDWLKEHRFPIAIISFFIVAGLLVLGLYVGGPVGIVLMASPIGLYSIFFCRFIICGGIFKDKVSPEAAADELEDMNRRDIIENILVNINDNRPENRRENTMTDIIYTTAIKSVNDLRERTGFDKSKHGSNDEVKLIENFRKTLLKKQKNLGGLKGNRFVNINVALRALKNPHFSGALLITGVSPNKSMRNILALYLEAIKQELFISGVSAKDAENVLISALADCQRGGNRNNSGGIDDHKEKDSPVCGRGHFNKLAEKMLTILSGMNIIFDLDYSAHQALVRNISSTLKQKYNHEEYEAIKKFWNEGDGEEPEKYNEFKEFIISNFFDLVNSMANQIVDDLESKEIIKRNINKDISGLGSLNQYIENITLIDIEVAANSAPIIFTNIEDMEEEVRTILTPAVGGRIEIDSVSSPGPGYLEYDEPREVAVDISSGSAFNARLQH